jgi:hypothetical protein
MNRRVLIVLSLLSAAAPAGAQSLFGMRGLGVPVDPIDPRARALGSLGTGLLGLNTSLVNPADLAGIRRRGVSATLQPFFGSAELGGLTDNVEGTRFPLIQIMYPARERLVVSLGYGGFLEQSWAVSSNSQEIIGGQPVATSELVSARGAVAQARVSAAYDVSPSVAVGVAAGVYTGDLEREVTRTFPDTANEFVGFTRLTSWDYRGYLGSLGVRLDPSRATRIAAALTWSSNLDAEPDSGGVVVHTYELPLRFVVGGSALIAPRLLATASAQYSGWSDAADYAPPGTPVGTRMPGRPAWEFGAGVEWERLRTAGRVFPLRLGYRYAQLPFHLTTDEPANEWAASLGLGLRLAGDDFGPLAVADFGLERGRRSGWDGNAIGALTENYWRFSASISLFGR